LVRGLDDGFHGRHGPWSITVREAGIGFGGL
jgi:hypothetical protein